MTKLLVMAALVALVEIGCSCQSKGESCSSSPDGPHCCGGVPACAVPITTLPDGGEVLTFVDGGQALGVCQF